jgi:hypothetical protein
VIARDRAGIADVTDEVAGGGDAAGDNLSANKPRDRTGIAEAAGEAIEEF